MDPGVLFREFTYEDEENGFPSERNMNKEAIFFRSSIFTHETFIHLFFAFPCENSLNCKKKIYVASAQTNLLNKIQLFANIFPFSVSMHDLLVIKVCVSAFFFTTVYQK